VFVKDEAEIGSRVGDVKSGVVHFGKLFIESNKQEFSLSSYTNMQCTCH